MKRLITLTLAIMFFTSVFAIAADNDKSKHEFSDVDVNSGYLAEVDALSANGIIQGDDNGNFRPNDSITRAEFAAIICRAMGEAVVEDALRPENQDKDWYTDVTPDHWAAGYIFTATAYGAMNGYGDGRFGPEDPVTNEQVIKTLVSAWGYSAEAEKLGGYPNGYMEIAHKYGVLDTVSFNYGNASKRWVVSMFVYGVLEKLPVSESSEKRPSPPILPQGDSNLEKKEPLSEYNGKLPDDPISVLKKVTNQSAKYEETTFIYMAVEPSALPFTIEQKSFFFKEVLGERKAKIRISAYNGRDTIAQTELSAEQTVFNLATLGVGEWDIVVSVFDNAIDDEYQGMLKNTGDDFSITEIRRVVKLNVEAKIGETRTALSLSNETTNESLPFIMQAACNNNGEIVLYIDCNEKIDTEHFFQVAINHMDMSAYQIPVQIINGTNEKIQPIVVTGIKQDVDYYVEIGIFSEHMEQNAIKGKVKFSVHDGKADYLFEGEFIELVVDGYEITDYPT